MGEVNILPSRNKGSPDLHFKLHKDISSKKYITDPTKNHKWGQDWIFSYSETS